MVLACLFQHVLLQPVLPRLCRLDWCARRTHSLMLVFWIGNVCVALRTYSHTFRAGLGGTGRVGLGSSGAGLGWDESIAQAHVLPTSFSGR